jgi:hypothetical protein
MDIAVFDLIDRILVGREVPFFTWAGLLELGQG